MSGSVAARLLAALAACLAPLPALVTAQEASVVEGLILDARTEAPLPGVTVTVTTTGARTVTDRDGRFLFPVVEPGRLDLRAARDGWVTLLESVEVRARERLVMQVLLSPVAAILEELVVLAERGAPTAGGADPERRSTRTAADLVMQQLPGAGAALADGAVRGDFGLLLRGAASISLSTAPAVYLDGIRIDPTEGGLAEAFQLLQQIPASDVERIRVVRGASGGLEIHDTANGAILVETRTGGG